jgi:hypothetical protein
MPRWVERWHVRSHTNPDKEYTVSLAEDGETWGCSCPAWTFQRHRIRDGICKHIRQIKQLEEMRFAEEQEQEEIMIAEEFAEERSQHGFVYPDNVTHDDFFTEEEFTL